MKIRQKTKQFIIPKSSKIIIDTDVGGDDAQALILAISQAQKYNKQIIGITCVNGNTTVDNVIKNVLICLGICNKQIPIYKGCQDCLITNSIKDKYFNQDGLGTKQIYFINKLKQQGKYKQNLLQNVTAAQFIVHSAQKYKQQLSIIAIGPLSNLALAYHLDSTIINKIIMLSIMGGSYDGIGLRQFFTAEFNFNVDAQAAKIVFQVYSNIIISTFTFTLDIGVSNTIDLFNNQSTIKGSFINSIYQNILKNEQPILCDPIAVLPILRPDLIHEVYSVECRIQTQGPRTRGFMAIDWLKQNTNMSKNASTKKCLLIASIDLPSTKQLINDSYKD